MLATFWRLLAKALILTMLVLGMSFGFAPFSYAQTGDEVKSETVDNWLSQLERIEKNADILQSDDAGLTRLQEEAQKLGLEIEKYRVSLTPKITELKSQIDKLGAEPGKEEPEEATAIKAERKRLNDDFQRIDGEFKRAGVATTRTTQIISRIQELRRNVFARQIFKRQTSLYHVSGWTSLFADIQFAGQRLVTLYQDWVEKAAPLSRILWLLGGILIFISLAHILTVKLINRFRALPDGAEPVFLKQAASTVSVSLLRMLPGLLAIGILYGGLTLLDAFTPLMRQFLTSLLFFSALVIIVASLSTTLLAPNRGGWRMVDLSDRNARRMNNLIIGLSFAYGLNRFGVEVNQMISAPISLTWLVSLVSSILFVVVLVMLLRIPFGMKDVKGKLEPVHLLWPLWLKLPLWMVVAAIAIALPLGYFAFAEFLAGQVVLTGAIIIIVLLIHQAIGELRQDMVDAEGLIGRQAKHHLHMDQEPRKLLAFGISFLLNGFLLIVAIPLVLFNWGFSWADLHSWMLTLFYGFEVGSFRFSMAAIMMGIALFALGILLTRFLQRWLDAGVLKSPRIQSGLSNSIKTGVGYLGFLLSALISVSYVGLDFTNLAIVAGALSVGIGFGLQSIVNNFVSGLILLVERPVKVGDWVIVGDYQGFVRRISVRSTEIETFDRSTVIVPNSELITGVVTNWTHGNSTGRVIVGVGVAYHSDPRQVYNILEKIAKEHPKTLTYPAPRIVFEDFGASSLDFTIRVYIGNITEVLDVTTELRMRVFETFKAENIEIAFPQLDIHLKR